MRVTRRFQTQKVYIPVPIQKIRPHHENFYKNPKNIWINLAEIIENDYNIG
jgi:hypothetical protein